jgi:NAD(P)-dependent dehydrogenase (short-subunit alcohol dehydrogenase family)
MAHVLITGSSDGLGLMAGRLLIGQGHAVTLHARNDERAAHARELVPAAENVLVGDLRSLDGIRSLAAAANAAGRFDAVIHNAGIGYREPRRVETVDGLSELFTVNVLAPYLLTALMTRPDRLVYLSSGMAGGGDADLSDAQWTAGAGTGRRRTATASCSTSCSRSASHGAGRTCARTPWNPGGSRRRWAGAGRRTIWIRAR